MRSEDEGEQKRNETRQVGEFDAAGKTHRVVMSLQKLHKPRHDSAFDDLLDGRVALNGQQAAEILRGLGLGLRVVGHDVHEVLVDLLHVDVLDGRTGSCHQSRRRARGLPRGRAKGAAAVLATLIFLVGRGGMIR